MHLRRRPLAAIASLLLLVPLFAACIGDENPEGWAPPVGEGDTLLLSLSRGELSATTFGESGPVRVRWTFPNDNRKDERRLETEAIYQAPVIDGNRVYVATHGEGVFALERLDGAVAWNRRDLGDNIVSAFAQVPGGRIAVGTSGGTLHLLSQADGTTVPGWPAEGRRLPAGIWASLAVSGDLLITATMKGEVYAFSIATGEPVWLEPFRADGAILDLELLPNGLLFVPSLDRHVYLVDAATGKEAARVPTQDWVWMRPAVDSATAYFGDLGGNVYAIDITTGAVRWSLPPDARDGFPAFARLKSPPAVIGGTLVVADKAPAVHFIEAATGRRLNRVPLDAKTVRAPVVASGTDALVLTTNGKLFRARPAELSVIEIPIGSQP